MLGSCLHPTNLEPWSPVNHGNSFQASYRALVTLVGYFCMEGFLLLIIRPFKLEIHLVAFEANQHNFSRERFVFFSLVGDFFFFFFFFGGKTYHHFWRFSSVTSSVSSFENVSFIWGISWNNKQPFINRCLVISNHFLCKDWESSN